MTGSDTPPPIRSSMVESLQAWLMEQLRIHGISLFLLAVVAWNFHNENLEMKAEIRECHNARLESYQNNQVLLLGVVNNNTRALEAFLQKMEE